MQAPAGDASIQNNRDTDATVLSKHSMTPKCPNCGSVVYSRRNVLCGVCGQRLPAHLLFTPEERENVERDLKEAKRRMHIAMEERQARDARDNI